MDELPKDHPAWPDGEGDKEQEASYLSSVIMMITGAVTALAGWVILKTVETQVMTLPPSERPDVVCGAFWGCGYATPSIPEVLGIVVMMILMVGVLAFTGRNAKRDEE